MSMKPFKAFSAIAAPIDEPNLDTNQICPTRFNKLPLNDPEYARVLFNEQRFSSNGRPKPAFILNQSPFDQAKILVGDRNWGCGSSRESAVYALQSFGIRCVIAPSFGDIHYANALKNGLLPVVLPRKVCDRLRRTLHQQPGGKISIDLVAQSVRAPDGALHRFEIQASRKRALLLGQDDIDVTLEYAEQIHAFERNYQLGLPWVYLGGSAHTRPT